MQIGDPKDILFPLYQHEYAFKARYNSTVIIDPVYLLKLPPARLTL